MGHYSVLPWDMERLTLAELTALHDAHRTDLEHAERLYGQV